MSKVVVLEDDADLRYVMREMFEMLGAQCLPVGSLAELHEKAGEVLQSDLAVLDVNLGPGRPNGLDAYGWLAESGYRGRIVFLTAHASSHPLVTAACKLPGVTVFEKPLGLEQFQLLLEPRP